MTEVNFVSKDKTNQEQIARIRRMVLMVTTGVLVAYLIGVAGVFGWWWYWSSKQKRTSADIVSYLTQMQDYSDAEVVVRRLGARADAVESFLAGRGSASDAGSILATAADVEVTAWDYNAGGSQAITVKTSDPEKIFDFTKYLEDKYSVVQPDEVGWSVLDGWYARILASGRKKSQS